MAVEEPRKCGYRRTGGTYIVGSGDGEPCHRLPWRLETCPTCSGGIKPSRGWTWMSLALFKPGCASKREAEAHCMLCCVCSPSDERVGLLWIGGSFYETAAIFEEEAHRMGISRRVPALPLGFEVGKTLVLLAHRRLVRVREVAEGCDRCPLRPPGAACFCACECHLRPGIFRVWKPEAVELILRQSDATPDRIAREAQRGVRVVAVPDGDPHHDPAGPNGADDS